ncbi:Mss4-like protein [Glarea lozoyensis ATCC 20868]|uniref:Mss4-like protein n=1 Tax=Glarea lozoyensis (strain ATCC 20868 / MF5171) TaxID=1116229 RepID=S3D1F4_GLAL2|nr:Mss4-like protein [Glarea lozoyensis ATCC 20868]EPE31665.1 Mss4-like protein [Glarea lozoyensis ATCC 20868]
MRKYNAIKSRGTPEEEKCSSERNFCGTCSTMLWLWDKQWPELIHPFASAIDTELPVVDEMVCVMGNSKPAWVRLPEGKKSVHEVYGEDSIEGWHKKKGLWVE